MLLFGTVCLAACGALLGCERVGYRPGVWISKPLAATCFVAAALAAGALDSAYGRLVLVALCLSWLGDVLLIPRGQPRMFLAGLASFLLAHVVFGVAFFVRGLAPVTLAISAAFGAGMVWAALGWLGPHLTGVFKRAVPAYTVVIAAMLCLAISATAAAGPPTIAAGAAMFAISDLAVARDRLIEASFWNGAWGLPLYFTAQLVLASTVAATAPAL